MSKEFIPYEEALALKKLGFDEPCYNQYPDCVESIPAPLYQQAFRWFREKYKLFSEVNLTTKQENVESFEFFVLNVNEPLFESDDYTVYEEAELACLRKLIEIVKTK